MTDLVPSTPSDFFQVLSIIFSDLRFTCLKWASCRHSRRSRHRSGLRLVSYSEAALAHVPRRRHCHGYYRLAALRFVRGPEPLTVLLR